MTKYLNLTALIFLCNFIQGNDSGWVIFNCEDEFAQGIYPDGDNEWKANEFEKINFTLALSNDLKEIKISEDQFTFICSRYISTILPFLTCADSNNNGMNIKFNIETNKYMYLRSSHAGYTNNGQSDSDSFHAGNCKRFIQ